MSNNKDSLGDRMKKSYEYITRTFLTRRIPVIIRLDGKAFHTFTRGFDKPFDGVLMRSMQRTMKYMCENSSWSVCKRTEPGKYIVHVAGIPVGVPFKPWFVQLFP